MKFAHFFIAAGVLLPLVGCFAHAPRGTDDIVDHLSSRLALNLEQQKKLALAAQALPTRRDFSAEFSDFFESTEFDSAAVLNAIDLWYRKERTDLERSLPLVEQFYSSLSDDQKQGFRKELGKHKTDRKRHGRERWWRS